ncbi:hypothetical protein IFM89_011995 [Coptis chinensis]|uniref:Uncharacterized protein n=1 Tax=Coptis chinensis TaxID=261450 RepID=A0A835M7S2_9MAGN|nr:hypothetical protein IFM89_011995 [Coptis chinensis]
MEAMVEFVLEHHGDLSLYLRTCKSLQLSPDFLLPHDIGYDEITNEAPDSTIEDYDESTTSSSESSWSKNVSIPCTNFVKKKRSGLFVCARSASRASSSSEEDMVTSMNRRKRIPHRSPLC